MGNYAVELGLRGAVKTETIAQTCARTTEQIDGQIAVDFATWLSQTMMICRASSDRELSNIARNIDNNTRDAVHALEVLWHVYYISRFRKRLEEAFGKEKTEATYEWARNNLTTRSRRAALYANLYKLSTFSDFKEHLQKIGKKEHVLLVKLIDAVTNTKKLVECNPLHMSQHESEVTADKASLKEKIISSILPDPNAGIKGLLENTFKMIKDNVSPTGKKDSQTLDELCMELCASPCSILMMTVAACVAGSTGLIMVMAPLFAAWSAITTVSGAVKEHADNSNLHNFLKNATATILTGDYRPDLDQANAQETENASSMPSRQVSELRVTVGDCQTAQSAPSTAIAQ